MKLVFIFHNTTLVHTFLSENIRTNKPRLHLTIKQKQKIRPLILFVLKIFPITRNKSYLFKTIFR